MIEGGSTQEWMVISLIPFFVEQMSTGVGKDTAWQGCEHGRNKLVLLWRWKYR